MRFSNRIYLKPSAKTMDDFIKEAQAKKAGLAKVASATGHQKKANLDNIPADKRAKPFGKEEEEEGKDKEECVEASAETEVKVASEEKQQTTDSGKKEGTEFVNDDIKEPTDADVAPVTGGDKKPEAKKGKDGTETSGQPQWEGKPENNNNPWKDPKAKEAGTSAPVKIAVPSGKFELIANLKPELKKKTREYWLSLYPADYVDAMLADK